MEISESVKAMVLDVVGALMRSGLEEAALSRFAELVRDRAERCALTVRKSAAETPTQTIRFE